MGIFFKKKWIIAVGLFIILAGLTIFISPPKDRFPLISKSGHQQFSPTNIAYQATAIERLHQQGAVEAQLYLKKLLDEKHIMAVQCHKAYLALGAEAVKKYGDPAVALSYEQGYCSDGYTHGVFYQILGGSSTISDSAFKKATDLCSKWQDGHFNCFHGIGHGSMLANNHGLGASLTLCDKISNELYRSGCYDGAFHAAPDLHSENAIEEKSGLVKKGDPLFTCNQVHEKYKLICYWRFSPNSLFVTDSTHSLFVTDPTHSFWENAMRTGQHVPTEFKKAFWYGVGRDTSFVAQGEANKAMRWCGALHTEGESDCVGGVALHMLTRLHFSIEKVREFCKSIPEAEVQSACLQSTSLLSHYPLSLQSSELRD